MAKALVVVESPTKVKTLSKYLGRNYTVKASVGHVVDLPKSKLGVEINGGFTPVYEVIKGKQKVLDEIKKAAKAVDTVFLAPDPDREGEAIAWHIAHHLTGTKKTAVKAKIFRVLINEITKRGVEAALREPLELNRPRYEAQQARRILDRLVGYQVSPILWDKVRRGLSAGRVQSVALRILVDREREIQAFTAVEYWSVDVRLRAKEPPPFLLHVLTRDGKKFEIPTGAEARAIEAELRKQEFVVAGVEKQQRRRTPPPPFTTSKLQQEAARKLGFTAKKTMMVAQQLYEGIELGAEGSVGLITYMRTDSTRIAHDALEAARRYIGETYGHEYLPMKPRFYRVSTKAQDAHEAIRPTLLTQPPERVTKHLKKDQLALYRLIWDRFIACQMNEAVYDQTAIDVTAGRYGLRATGSILKYDGYLKVYIEGRDEADSGEEGDGSLPDVTAGERLRVEDVIPEQHFTKPPARFTEASLVKELEEDGIGRPSTYASILSTIQERKYVQKDQGRFFPTDLGMIISDLLVAHFPDVVDVKFTAQMEAMLDQVEEGERNWQEILKEFYGPFEKALKSAKKKMRDVKREETPTDHVCEKCGKMMVIKWGRHGHFLACSGYPDCKSTKEFRKTPEGKIEILAQPTTDAKCEDCGAPMVVKTGRFGKFLACSRYPECKRTQSISTGVPCPEKGCEGKLVERRSRRGKVFYGCSRYPECKHASWNKPVATPCPDCKAPYLVEKFTKKDGAFLACVKEGCGYRKSLEAEPAAEASA